MKIYDYQGRSNICGEQIRRFRRERKLSQGELAARLQLQEVQLDQKAVSRVEKGERSCRILSWWPFPGPCGCRWRNCWGFRAFQKRVLVIQ